jgi:hypothetical protein
VNAVEIRPATPADAAGLRDLAERDSARVPSGRVVIALSCGAVRAAVSIDTGETIADPFVPTADMVDALTALARDDGHGRRREWRRTPPKPQPAI